MVDDVNLEGTENTLPTLSNQIGWVTFDETDNKDPICNNCMAEEKISGEKGRYISRLGEFKVLRIKFLLSPDPARCI